MDRIELASHINNVADRLVDARRSLLGSAGVEQSDVNAANEVWISLSLLKTIHETINQLTD